MIGWNADKTREAVVVDSLPWYFADSYLHMAMRLTTYRVESATTRIY